jgi:response regulator RpfG family c-di-GMP phosphodiesterase
MTIEVTSTVTTAELKVGDRTGAGKVLEIDRKQVWALVHIADVPKPIRVKMDATWTVTRTEKTEEEIAAERAEITEMIARNARKSSAAAFVAAREKMIKTLSTPSFMLSHWDFSALAETQATEELWTRVDMIEQRVTAGLIDPLTFVEIVEKVRERCREDLLNFRASSRSTSTMSNAVEDAQLEAKRQFIDHWM